MVASSIKPLHPDRVHVLAVDPDLAGGLDPGEREAATREAHARILELPAGEWKPPRGGDRRGALGVLVLDGVLIRTVRIGRHGAAELIGPGDLIRPWESDEGGALVACADRWQVLQPVRMALLDREFAHSICRWPEVTAQIVGLALRRTRSQGLSLVISRINRVDERLLMLFMHLAGRFGRVTPHGLAVRLPLTHEMLARLVGARRPSVTTALTGLAERNLVERWDERLWIVTAEGQVAADRICAEPSEVAANERGSRPLPEAGPSPLAA